MERLNDLRIRGSSVYVTIPAIGYFLAHVCANVVEVHRAKGPNYPLNLNGVVKDLHQWMMDNRSATVPESVGADSLIGEFANYLGVMDRKSQSFYELFESREREEHPFQLLEGRVLIASQRSICLRPHVAIIGVLDFIWGLAWKDSGRQSGLPKKGDIYELVVREVVDSLLGESTISGRSFFPIDSSSEDDDIDLFWVGPGGLILVGESKSYAPQKKVEDAARDYKVNSVPKVEKQLAKRRRSILRNRAIRVDGNSFNLDFEDDSIFFIGVYLNPLMGGRVTSDERGYFHHFLIDGLCLVLASISSEEEFHEYLIFRQLNCSDIFRDEADVLANFLIYLRGAPEGQRFEQFMIPEVMKKDELLGYDITLGSMRESFINNIEKVQGGLNLGLLN